MPVLPATVLDEPQVNPALIQRMYAQNCSQDEFVVFLNLAHKYGLDPSLKQIWAIKYPGGGPATIIVSRDGLLDIAHRNPNFDGMETGYTGTVKDGDLVGWCKVYRKDMSRPFMSSVLYEEYVQTKKSGEITKFWKKMPVTMIQKVAQAQALRQAFSVQGLYSEDEMPRDLKEIPDTSVPVVDLSMNKCNECGAVINPEHIEGILKQTDGVPMCDACYYTWSQKHESSTPAVAAPKPEPITVKPIQKAEPAEPKNTCAGCGKEIPAGSTHCMDCVTAEHGKIPEEAKPIEPEPVQTPEPTGPVCEHCGGAVTKKNILIGKKFNDGHIWCDACLAAKQRGEF